VSNLRRQLKERDIRPRKSLGQHFVVDARVLGRIVDCAELEKEDIVVEIGAGVGNLTAPLAERVKKVYALEIDPRLAEVLREKFGRDSRVEIIEGDALPFDFASLLRKGRQRMKVVANLPYEISSPMIFRLLEERKCFSLLVLMLQMEVARRIVAERGTKDYGPLSVWCQLYTRPEIMFSIPPGAFHPRPRVDSALMKFEILPRPKVEIGDEQVLHRVIRSAFGHRRKTLTNAIQMGEFAHLPKERVQQVLRSIGINPDARGETLTLKQFGDLARAISTAS